MGTRRGSVEEFEAGLALAGTDAMPDIVGKHADHPGYKVSEHLPGPLDDKDRDEVLTEIFEAGQGGTYHNKWMEWQEQYGEAGLSSNIVVPHLARALPSPAHGEFQVDGRPGIKGGVWLTEKVMLGDPEDCIRIARTHTQKEPNFQLLMGDSVISAIDNKAWRDQRNHMTQAFLPMSSLAHIFPISNQRAVDCADILKRISQGGTQKVNMSEFYLNETQQQLHLALFGESNDEFDEALNTSFRDSLGGPPSTPSYSHRHAAYAEEQKKAAAAAKENPNVDPRTTGPIADFMTHINKFVKDKKGEFGAPTDLQAVGIDPTTGVPRNPDGSLSERKIRGPLSAVLADKLAAVRGISGGNELQDGYDELPDKMKKQLDIQTDFGNAFIFAFAGHDTTGHTLTWLTYELAKHPEMQQRVIDEVDAFWEKFGDRPIGTGGPDSVEFVEFMKVSMAACMYCSRWVAVSQRWCCFFRHHLSLRSASRRR